jgi:tight adherence protein B
VADFAEVVAIGLRAGLDLPSAALASASSPGVVAAAPWLGRRLRLGILRGQGVSTLLDLDLDPGVGPGSLAGGAPADEVAVAEAGDADAGAPSGAFVRGPLGDPVRRPLGALERRDLAHLVAAWRLAEEVGAAAAAVTASAASSVRERQVAQERTAVVMAGPRASMLLLSALPLAGPLAALVAGVPPGRLYDSAPSRLLAAGGLALTALGWWWARRLLTRAGRPARTDAEPR